MSAANRLTVRIGVITMVLLSWAAFVSASGPNCPSDVAPKTPCLEATNLVNACFVQEKYCDAAAAQLLADANQFNEASKKCSQQWQTCYGDAAKICGCPSAVPTSGGSAPVSGGFASVTPATVGGGVTLPSASVTSSQFPWVGSIPAGQRGGQRVGTDGSAPVLTCADGTPIPTDPAQLKLWLETIDVGADVTSNDLDYDGVPDYKIKAHANIDGTFSGYVIDRYMQCDTCVKGDNICSGPEGGDPAKEPCYNPSQKKICK